MKDANDFTPLQIQMISLNRMNWEVFANLQVKQSQESFLPMNLISIAQSRFEPSDLFGFQVQEKAIGFAMVGYWSGIAWINRFMIDKDFQGKGLGKQALHLLISYLQRKPNIPEVRTTISQQNIVAEYLFSSFGFQKIGNFYEENIFSLVF